MLGLGSDALYTALTWRGEWSVEQGRGLVLLIHSACLRLGRRLLSVFYLIRPVPSGHSGAIELWARLVEDGQQFVGLIGKCLQEGTDACKNINTEIYASWVAPSGRWWHRCRSLRRRATRCHRGNSAHRALRWADRSHSPPMEPCACPTWRVAVLYCTYI